MPVVVGTGVDGRWRVAPGGSESGGLIGRVAPLPAPHTSVGERGGVAGSAPSPFT